MSCSDEYSTWGAIHIRREAMRTHGTFSYVGIHFGMRGYKVVIFTRAPFDRNASMRGGDLHSRTI